MTNERAAKILRISAGSSYSADVGQVLKDVYGNDERQAAAAMKAAAIDARRAGQTLRDVYGATAGQAAELLKESGYTAENVGAMLALDYGANGPETAKALRDAGYAIGEAWFGLGYASNHGEAIRSAYSAMETYDFLWDSDGRFDSAVSYMKSAGFTAAETAAGLLKHPVVRTKADLLAQLMQTYPESMATYRYSLAEAIGAARLRFGGDISEYAAMLSQHGMTTITTMQPGQATVASGLGTAGYNLQEIAAWLAPSNSLTQAQASNVLFELRNMGYRLSGMGPLLTSLARKVYSDTSNQSLVRLLATSGTNTATGATIPGYSALEIAQFLIAAGRANNYNLGPDLTVAFAKLDAVSAMKEASGATLIDMLRALSDSRLFTGAVDYLFLGQVLRDVYGADPVEAVLAMKGSSIPTLYEMYPITEILKTAYGHTDTTTLILDLSSAGFNMYQIGDALMLSGASFKAAGYDATSVAQFIYRKRGVQLDVMVPALKNLGYDLYEVTTALRGLYGGGSSSSIVSQVTDMLDDSVYGYPAAEVMEAVATVFGVDPFAVLARNMKERNYPATQTAATLKALYEDMGAIDMARGLATAGYDQDGVLKAIFQVYCNGYIYSPGAATTMDEVITSVYPAETNRWDATLRASDVRTAKYAIQVMRSLEKPLSDTVGVLQRVYALNALDALRTLLEMSAWTKELLNAVGAAYGENPVELYLRLMKAKGTHANEALIVLQQTFDYDDSVEIGKLMFGVGYTRTEILNAIDRYYGGDVPNAIALTMVELFGENDILAVGKELRDRGYAAPLIYSALMEAFPNSSQGDVLVALRDVGVGSLISTLTSIQSGDATAVAQLRNLGLRAEEAGNFLGRWQYSLQDGIRNLIALGYTLQQVGRGVESGYDVLPEQAIRAMRAMNYPLERIVKIAYALDERPALLLIYLYKEGYTDIVDLIKALGIVNEDPLRYVYDLWSTKLYVESYVQQNQGGIRQWTGKTLAIALAQHSDLTLAELGRSFVQSNSFTNKDIYYALKEVAEIGVSFIQSDLDAAISAMLTELSEGIPFAIMNEAGVSSNDAARVMKQLGWDWIPACIQLVQAGYGASDTWDALWDVYHNELGFQILNIMSAVAPLASLGLAQNLSTFESVLKGAMQKAMMSYFTRR